MMHRRPVIAASAALSVLLALPAPLAADIVGEVILPADISVDHIDALYRLERLPGGEGICARVPDLRYMVVPICPGDRITVVDPYVHLELRSYGSTKTRRLDRHSTPYKILAGRRSLALIDYVSRHLWSLVEPFAAPPTDRHVMLMARSSRDGELSLPMLDGGETLLAAGTRSLSLVWSGGRPPFTVTVRTAEGQRIDRWPNLQERRLDGETIRLSPGRHTLSLDDGNSETEPLSFPFTVVDSGELPKADKRITIRGDADSRFAETIHATWLAAEDRVWIWESFSRVMPLARDFPPAAALASHLARGRIPGP